MNVTQEQNYEIIGGLVPVSVISWPRGRGTDLEPGFQLALKGSRCLPMSAGLEDWQHPREDLLLGVEVPGWSLYLDVWSRYRGPATHV